MDGRSAHGRFTRVGCIQSPLWAHLRPREKKIECLLLRIILELVRFRNLLEDSSHSDSINQSRQRGLADTRYVKVSDDLRPVMVFFRCAEKWNFLATTPYCWKQANL
jgi:hypothetical protein